MGIMEGLRSEFSIRGRKIGNGELPYIIAEMACAHNGEVEQAREITLAAARANADAIQFQFFVPEETVTPQHEAYSVIKDISFKEQDWVDLTNLAREKDLHVWVCTYDVPSVELAVKLDIDGIKLNSADLLNPDVLEAVASSGIPFTLGTGASMMEEINKGLQFLKSKGASKIILMHGVQNFPTEIPDLNINRLELLQEHFSGLPVGYADHTSGDHELAPYIDFLAVGKGAAVLEKHITLDRSMKGIDFQAALEPDRFVTYVKAIQNANDALGSNKEQPFTDSDLKYRKFQKKSIVASRNIEAGESINRSMVKFIRNVEPGLAPVDFDKIDGKTASQPIDEFENISFEKLD